MKIIDYTGKRIGILTIIEKTEMVKYKKKSRIYKCLCDCGNWKELSTAEFSSAKSCGCLRKQQKNKFKTMNIGKIQPWTLPPFESLKRTLLTRYKKSAIKRNYNFDLCEKDFRELVFNKCFYCNREPSQEIFESKKPNIKLLYNGIDRIDNSKGYVKENCVSCCKHCNRAKDVMSCEEFKIFISNIFNNLKLL